jgi:hypothetical protein
MLEPLLARYSGEAREVLLFDIYRMFCRLAGSDSSAAENWLYLARRGTVRRFIQNVSRAGVIKGIAALKLQSGGQAYKYLKRWRQRLLLLTKE